MVCADVSVRNCALLSLPKHHTVLLNCVGIFFSVMVSETQRILLLEVIDVVVKGSFDVSRQKLSLSYHQNGLNGVRTSAAIDSKIPTTFLFIRGALV